MKMPWNAVIKGKQIVITMDIKTLLQGSPSMVGFEVSKEKGFAQEIVNELLAEEEDGTTPIHRMFDDVITTTIENGAEGVEEEK